MKKKIMSVWYLIENHLKLCYIIFQSFWFKIINMKLLLLGRTTSEYESFFDNLNRKVIKLNLNKYYGNDNLNRFLFALKVIKFLRKNKYDIVHIDISCRFFGLIKLFSKRGPIFIFHILSYPITSSKLKRIKMMIITYLQGLLMNVIIVQNQEIKERWIGIKHLDKAIVIPVGFDKNLFYQVDMDSKAKLKNKLHIPYNGYVLAYSGVLSPTRNLENLIYSLRIIRRSYKNVFLIFIGAGKAEGKLNELAELLKLHQSIIFTGFVPHEDVVKYLNLADIAIS